MTAAAELVDFELYVEPEDSDLPTPHCLADLLRDPEALKPPEEVVFPLGYRGRSVLLSAREKDGKSTLAAGAIAARSCGTPFLGKRPTAGLSLLVGLEEHPHDIVRRFRDFRAYPEAVYILDRLGADRWTTLENAVRYSGAGFVVVDTLAAFGEGLDLKSGDSMGWAATVNTLTRIARTTDVGLCIVHHGRKEDGSYRDSTAIGAAVDMLLALSDADVHGVKKLTPKGRWPLDAMEYRIEPAAGERGPRFVLTGGDVPVDLKVFLFVQANPGASTRDVRDGVKGRNEEKARALTRLEGRGFVENRPDGRGHHYYAIGKAEDLA